MGRLWLSWRSASSCACLSKSWVIKVHLLSCLRYCSCDTPSGRFSYIALRGNKLVGVQAIRFESFKYLGQYQRDARRCPSGRLKINEGSSHTQVASPTLAIGSESSDSITRLPIRYEGRSFAGLLILRKSGPTSTQSSSKYLRLGQRLEEPPGVLLSCQSYEILQVQGH
jgi:hypothetical protein